MAVVVVFWTVTPTTVSTTVGNIFEWPGRWAINFINSYFRWWDDPSGLTKILWTGISAILVFWSVAAFVFFRAWALIRAACRRQTHTR